MALYEVDCSAQPETVHLQALLAECRERIDKLEARNARIPAMTRQFQRLSDALSASREMLSEAVAQIVDREAIISDLSKRAQAAEARLEYYEPRPGHCEHGIAEGEWCAPCNQAYKQARRDNSDP